MQLIKWLFLPILIFAGNFEDIVRQLPDLCNPTLEEYQLLDRTLKERTFVCEETSLFKERFDHFLRFQLLLEDGQMPVFQRHSFQVRDDTRYRCILLFASGNDSYAQRARELLHELEQAGYSGHVLLRIGGYPNLEAGSLAHADIPYLFKIAFLMEAKRLGYKEILWMDLALHPLTSLDMIFSEIQRKGYFFTSIGTLRDHGERHCLAHPSQLDTPHISSALLGYQATHSNANELIDLWEEGLLQATPSWYPDDWALSIAAWHLKAKPFSWYGTIVCSLEEKDWLPYDRPTIQVCTKRIDIPKADR